MNPLAAWTYGGRHKAHAATLIGLSAMVTLALCAMVALVWGVYVEQPRQSHMLLSRYSMVVVGSAEGGGEKGVMDQIRAHPAVDRVLPSISIRTEIPGMLPSEPFSLKVLGLAHHDLPTLLDELGVRLVEGQLPEEGTNEMILSRDAAAMLEIGVGDIHEVLSAEVYIGVDAPLEATPFLVVGILDSDIELGLASLEYLEGHRLYQHFPRRYLVAAEEGQKAILDAFLQQEIGPQVWSVMTVSKLNEALMSEALPGLLMLVPVILVVALALGLVIMAVNKIANDRRLPELGILLATGRSKRWLTRRLTLETVSMALVGWSLGMALAWAGIALVKTMVFAPRGQDLNYPALVPVLFVAPLPAAITGLTGANVRRTLGRLDPVAIVEQREQSQERESKRRRKPASGRRPMASWTFYRRHPRRAALLAAGMSMMILAVTLYMFALAVNEDAQEPLLGYLSRVSLVRSTSWVADLSPEVVERVKAHPAVERVISMAPRSSMLHVRIPPFTTAEANPFAVYAQDMTYLVALYDLELREGQLPRPGSNEMVIPEVVAKNRKIEVGDLVGSAEHALYPGAPSLPAELVVSGIFAQPARPEDGGSWGFISLEFLERVEAYPIPAVPPMIVVPKAGQKEALDDWLEEELASADVSVLTHRQEIDRLRSKVQQDMLGIVLFEGLLALVAALALAVMNHIFTTQRMGEFGVLHALGYSRGRLVGKVFGETAVAVVGSWAVSALLALLGMILLRAALFEPRGLSFGLWHLSPWVYTLPIPVLVLGVTAGSVARTLLRLDPISIIERRV